MQLQLKQFLQGNVSSYCTWFALCIYIFSALRCVEKNLDEMQPIKD